MQLTRRTVLLSAAAAGALAGCTDSDDAPDDGGSGGGSGPTLRVRSHADHGDVLVGPDGLTLYAFDQDTQGAAASSCHDGCAESWPPLTVDGEPTPAEGVSADVTTFDREGGDAQVAAGGWPLYHFAGDDAPGDANGQGVNDAWWVVAPDGTPVRPDGQGHEHEHDHETEGPDRPAEAAEVAMVSEDGHHFEPHLVWIEAGGTVTWTLESGAHTTTAYHADADRPQRIPDGAAGWDSGTIAEAGRTYERTFEDEGVYDYFCRPHEGMGMVGSVVVGEPDPHEQPGLEPPQETLPEAARTVLEELNEAANEALGHTHE